MFCLLVFSKTDTVSWLVQIKNYVIATSDLWLFIHASSLLPSNLHVFCFCLFVCFVVVVLLLFSGGGGGGGL